jgi:hypothetical protein
MRKLSADEVSQLAFVSWARQNFSEKTRKSMDRLSGNGIEKTVERLTGRAKQIGKGLLGKNPAKSKDKTVRFLWTYYGPKGS